MKPLFLLSMLMSVLFFSCSERELLELLPSTKTGIDFVNRVTESDSLHLINFEYIYNGAGVGISDLNNDGWQDLVFTGNQVSPRIYLNQGDWTFRDITSSFENIDNGQWYSGVTFADINLDGWQDVYFTCTAYADPRKRKNRFYVNHGPRKDGSMLFKDKAEAYGIADSSYTVHASFLDYDLDGDLDLYLLNNFANDRMSASYRPKINDGTAVSNDDLYRNNGNGTFTNVSLEAGIIYEGFGLGLAVGDLNKDGYPDLYISNDYVSNDLLYINQGDGSFSNEIEQYISYQSRSSMGNDMADINNDGFPDIITLDMLPMTYHKRKQTINGFPYIYYLNDATYGYEPQYIRNMLHLHNGMIDHKMIPFSEVGQMAGVFQSEWSWSPLLADFDNDGDKDLLIANGYPRDMTDKDWAKYKVRMLGNRATVRHVIERTPAVKVPNVAFVNTDDFSFENRSADWFRPVPSYSYGAAFTDLDLDGDLDYVVNNLNQEAFIYRNHSTERRRKNSHFLQIELRGDLENPMAIGAKVELWTRGKYQLHEHYLSRGYASSMDPVIHFGLQEATMVDSLKVTWPGELEVTLRTRIAADQRLLLQKENASSFPVTNVDSIYTEMPFQRVRGILDYKHHQEDVIDFYFAQTIIPHKFSQIGPAMQLGDLDGDGWEDLVVGASNVSPTETYLWDGSAFRKVFLPGLSGQRDHPEAAIAIFDVEGDGDQDVIALAGGYGLQEGQYVHSIYRNNPSSFEKEELPLPGFPASVVRPFDFDHDGDMDLFIGARIKVGAFPLAPESWILVNQGGDFHREHTISISMGMVTDAVWSDLDGDGWEDLLVTREWNSILLLKNRKGVDFFEMEIPAIKAKKGIWCSVTAGDFNQDGRDDYLLGNLGENHSWTVSDDYPLRIYALDLDRNGTIDPISTGYWENEFGVMEEFPINYLDELQSQAPYLDTRFPDYESFSYAPIDQILNEEMMSQLEASLTVNTTSSYILWNGEGQFHWQKLPRAAQMSPITQSLILDYNSDPFPDLILAGNDYSYDIATGYFDANKGLLLVSEDGQPLRKLLAPSQTGLVLQGMVESLLITSEASPVLIAGMNRDSAVTYRLNW